MISASNLTPNSVYFTRVSTSFRMECKILRKISISSDRQFIYGRNQLRCGDHNLMSERPHAPGNRLVCFLKTKNTLFVSNTDSKK
ncbi:hypothetical protein TMatcc_010148 [Talaromyces marneffei ATCC 18224]